MKISVVIPTFNRSQRVCKAINSVLAQTYHPVEIVVVDDGSTDDTIKVLRQFDDQITILTQPHRGVSSARNLGIMKSKENWVAFLDSDDEWLPSKLERQMEYHKQNPHLKISQTDEIWIRDGKRVNPMKKHQKFGGKIFRRCLPLCIVSPSAVIINRSLFEDVGLFDETLPVCEDYDMWLRISRKYEIGLLPEKLVVKHGGHDDQLSRYYWGMDRFRIQALEKHLSDEDKGDAFLNSDTKKAILTELIKKCRIVTKGAAKRGNMGIMNIYQVKLDTYQELLESI